ncbi:hypothetical protein [Roseicella aquatilis]|uniref:hypothetical protein n=1 Tax=Roseicella aquatilis TaxID=2527868 RepID=UPI0014045AB1|nr:hypothetical protein [Roseicella aquatilis]
MAMGQAAGPAQGRSLVCAIGLLPLARPVPERDTIARPALRDARPARIEVLHDIGAAVLDGPPCGDGGRDTPLAGRLPEVPGR